jgi:hypothetical protein
MLPSGHGLHDISANVVLMLHVSNSCCWGFGVVVKAYVDEYLTGIGMRCNLHSIFLRLGPSICRSNTLELQLP